MKRRGSLGGGPAGDSSSEVQAHAVGANRRKGRPGRREAGLLEELSRYRDGRREIHPWTARPDREEGAWFKRRRGELQRIGEMRLTFDSNFQRDWTVSAANSMWRNRLRGPRPETGRDSTVSYRRVDLTGVFEVCCHA